MSNTDWAAEQLDVYADFKAEGFVITVRQPGAPGTFNSETLEYDGAEADTDYQTFALKKSFVINQIDGTIVQQNDYILLFPAYGLPDLTLDDIILIGSAELNVVSLTPIDPGNVRLLYRGHIRG